MALPAHKLKTGRVVKLGRIIPAQKPRVVMLSSFWRPPEGKMGVPESIDYWSKAGQSLSQVLGNDRYGDCVIAGKLHQIGMYTANNPGAGGETVATDNEALTQYRSICGPGDNGCYIIDVLNAFTSPGLTAGGKRHTIDGYVGVDPTNLVELKTAIHLFGSVTFGIDLPASWMNTDDGEKWDVTNSGIIGGHDVPAIGYSKEGVVISTWGGKRTITWAELQSGRHITECYVQLAPDWYANSILAPSGINVEALKKALEDFKSGIIPPDEPPGPAPVPPAPLPPTPPEPSGPITVTLPAINFRTEPNQYVPLSEGQGYCSGIIEANGPIAISWGSTHHLMKAVPWVLIVSMLAKYLPIILADIAAGKTWSQILADILSSTKQTLGLESGKSE